MGIADPQDPGVFETWNGDGLTRPLEDADAAKGTEPSLSSRAFFNCTLVGRETGSDEDSELTIIGEEAPTVSCASPASFVSSKSRCFAFQCVHRPSVLAPGLASALFFVRECEEFLADCDCLLSAAS
jgi:hypothetical protein